MYIFSDLDFVEQLGSGMHRILNAYDKNIFKISENFLEICFPFSQYYLQSIQDTPQVKEQENKELDNKTPQVTPQVVKLVLVLEGELSRQEIQDKLDLAARKNLKERYINPALEIKFIEMTIPDKPNTPKQKYRLTEKGKQYKKQKTSCRKTYFFKSEYHKK